MADGIRSSLCFDAGRRGAAGPASPGLVLLSAGDEVDASGWITLHASLPDGAASGRVTIVLQRSASPQSTAVRLEAHGVTRREREVAALLAAGYTNPQIAEQLVLSPFTVQDDIKSLFAGGRRAADTGARWSREDRRNSSRRGHPRLYQAAQPS